MLLLVILIVIDGWFSASFGYVSSPLLDHSWPLLSSFWVLYTNRSMDLTNTIVWRSTHNFSNTEIVKIWKIFSSIVKDVDHLNIHRL